MCPTKPHSQWWPPRPCQVVARVVPPTWWSQELAKAWPTDRLRAFSSQPPPAEQPGWLPVSLPGQADRHQHRRISMELRFWKGPARMRHIMIDRSLEIAKQSVFPMICGSGGSKSGLAKAAGAEPSGQMRDEKFYAVVAWSIFRKSKCAKHTRFGPLLEVEMSKKWTP